jgi:hypothetical protein
MTDSGSAAPDQDTLPRWLPAVVFAFLTIICFRAYLFSPAGSMLVGQDTIAAGVMMRTFFVEQYHALGRLPLWNPYMYGGVPTIEAGSGDILYPLSFLLHMTLPMVSALAWKLILHVFLAGFSMYACARAFGGRRLVALFVGVSWMLSANLVSLVFGGQDGKMYVITLFPAALALLVRAMEKPTLLRFAWFGAMAALILIAHPQLAFYAWVALGLYALVTIVVRREEGTRPLVARLGGGVLALVVALGACALVLLPMYFYLRDVSPRAGEGIGYDKAATYSLNAEELVNFVVPDFTGVDETYWGRNPLKHNVEYGGAVVFALGVAGLFALRGDRRRIGLGVAAGVSLLYGLGANTPVFKLMYYTIPGLKRFRAPSLATFIALTALSLLAVLLLERILRDRESREGRIAGRVLAIFAGLCLLLGVAVQAAGSGALGAWFAVFGQSPRAQLLQAAVPDIAIGAILAALWLGIAWGGLWAWRRGMMGTTAFIVTLTTVTAVDGLRVDSRYVQVLPFEQFFPKDGGFDQLKQLLGPGERVLAIASSQLFRSGGPEGGYLAAYDIPEVFGYHSNQLRWYDQVTRREMRDQGGSDYWTSFLASPVLRALGTRVILVPGRLPAISGFQQMGGNQQVVVYRNSEALPGVAVIPTVTVQPDSTTIIDRLWTPGLDPMREAFVAAPVPAIGAGGGTGEARITQDGADSVSIEATTDGPALLLLSRTFHPAWRATVNGQAVEAVRTDHALIGVPLAAAGVHKIELAYRPPMVARAKLITQGTWAILLLVSLAAWAVPLVRRKQTHG